MSTLTQTDFKLAQRQQDFVTPTYSVDMRQVASVILGGGEGTRLHPLTLTRCKPAINFGGKYRLIDVPISNSIHADCHKIFVLTQFLSSSLHQHICQTYMQRGKSSETIEILTAEQRPAQKSWYQGTADAVRQNLDYLLEHPVEYYLILSGDQLYNINFKEMVQFARSIDADVVVAALPVNAQDATRMGVLKVDEHYSITHFHEKPEKELLAGLCSSNKILERIGISGDGERNYLGSMGIYLFKRDVLLELLTNDPREDFGKHLIPTLVGMKRAAAFLYEGYWEDIGTIETFFQANIALTDPKPFFSFHNEKRPIFTCPNDLPPAKILNTQITKSILCDGAVIEAEELTRTIVGPRSVIHKGTIIRDSYLIGNDYYESGLSGKHRLPFHPRIGENCTISRTIIDKNVVIGKDVKLYNKENRSHYDGKDIFIRDGIIIVPRGAMIPDGFIL